MHGKHVTIVDVGRVVRIQNLIRYEANTGFSNAEKPVLKPNRKTGSSGFFHTDTQPYYCVASCNRYFMLINHPTNGATRGLTLRIRLLGCNLKKR